MIKNLKTYNWQNAIRGMRNPLKSWNKIDTEVKWSQNNGEFPVIGPNDLKLIKQLAKAGNSHRKYLRQIQISFDLTACLKFFDEFATYQYVVSNSTSQMHGVDKKGFKFKYDDFRNKFYCDLGKETLFVIMSNANKILEWRERETDEEIRKKLWRDVIDIVPQSFLYTRTVTLNYEVFLAMYSQRKNHKMEEWVILMKELRNKLPYANELIEIFEIKKQKQNIAKKIISLLTNIIKNNNNDKDIGHYVNNEIRFELNKYKDIKKNS